MVPCPLGARLLGPAPPTGTTSACGCVTLFSTWDCKPIFFPSLKSSPHDHPRGLPLIVDLVISVRAQAYILSPSASVITAPPDPIALLEFFGELLHTSRLALPSTLLPFCHRNHCPTLPSLTTLILSLAAGEFSEPGIIAHQITSSSALHRLTISSSPPS